MLHAKPVKSHIFTIKYSFSGLHTKITNNSVVIEFCLFQKL